MSSLFPGVDFGPEVTEVARDGGCVVLRVENETGEGVMTCYRVFPGVVVMYSDFHMAYCVTRFEMNSSQLLCVDHCREGSMERLLRPEAYYYFSPNDVTVDVRRRHAGKTTFPRSHFHGVSLAFYLPEASGQLTRELAGFPVSLEALQRKFCPDGDPCLLRRAGEVSQSFGLLYRLPHENQREFLRLKVFELLLHLETLTLSEDKPPPYFYKSQVEKVKAAERLITGDLTERYTIETLSERFGLSQSALKQCFRAVYGQPVHTYLQEYRIRRAAELLRGQADLSVAQAAGQVGYDSPSKFAAMFKRVFGVSPKEYRNGGLL